ncbi:MAG: serine/threonine-protein kinase, partial [Myxococcota bacterium]
MNIEPGTVLLGKYRLERQLGQGGMGIVALATHLHLNQPVAIKFLLPEFASTTQVVERFRREAEAAFKLRSEHVCRIYDVGTLESGAPFMVMEFMDGCDLGELLAKQGPPTPSLTVDFILQACEALAEAHSLGIIHRDIKPSNFFLTHRSDGSPLVKLLDFGISKAPVAASQELTQTQNLLGTPAYMSPEQMRSSKEVDPRSDIWSLGIVLYQLMCGHRPFQAQAYSELCLQVAIDPVPPLPPGLLPPGLDVVVMRCLEKDPAQRFQNVGELAAALAPYAQSVNQAASTVERTARMLGLATVPPYQTAGPPTGDSRSPSTLGASAGQISLSTGTSPSAASAGYGAVSVTGQERPRRRWVVAFGAAATVLAA